MLTNLQDTATQDGQAERRRSSSLASTSAGSPASGLHSGAGGGQGGPPPRSPIMPPQHQSRSKRLASKMLKKLGTKERFRNPPPDHPPSGTARTITNQSIRAGCLHVCLPSGCSSLLEICCFCCLLQRSQHWVASPASETLVGDRDDTSTFVPECHKTAFAGHTHTHTHAQCMTVVVLLHQATLPSSLVGCGSAWVWSR